ncbi:MAG: hypothetical protein JOZ18_00165, partial [Chloroflexi bacterium]|nr:hypothetical protein [Chloroflexota bacterium]
MHTHSSRRPFLFLLRCTVIALMLTPISISHALTASPIEQAFQQAASDFGVPEHLLQALCYMEGHFSTHSGTPSIDGGYGC